MLMLGSRNGTSPLAIVARSTPGYDSVLWTRGDNRKQSLYPYCTAGESIPDPSGCRSAGSKLILKLTTRTMK